jgi:hypothetical protein
MPNWKTKAIVQKIISYLPHGYRLNFLMQKYITKGVLLSDEYFEDRLGHASDHLKAYQKHYPLSSLKTTLELGTGWYPVVPIAMFLAGAETIYSVDLTSLTDKDKLIKTIERFVWAYKNGSLENKIDISKDRIAVLEAVLSDFRSLSDEAILEMLQLKLLVGDARCLPLPSRSIDLIHSNNTFEHIYPGILKGILTEFKRLLDPKTGVMSHFIDMSYHFAHFDKNISIYNFLQYSDQVWSIIDNSIQPQNRWRFSEYLGLYSDLKISILHFDKRIGNSLDLEQIILDSKYANFEKDDLLVSHCRIESIG